jgi:tRNA1Val (adenine37-N6)-methyltransferase
VRAQNGPDARIVSCGMPNTYFQFKQFRIEQEHCAMKVGTDACILGAFLAGRIAQDARVLDIGSGTGLLLLMLAQKNKGRMDGIELEPGCFSQLAKNLGASPWKDRLQAIEGDIRQYHNVEKYDFIISNPPFYEDDLLSPSQPKNLAKHSAQLNLEELIQSIERLLGPLGSFGVLLPYHRSSYFETLAAQKHFYLLQKLFVRQTPEHRHIRSILYFSRERIAEPSESTLIIYSGQNNYSGEFVEMMKDYYLHLP